MTASLSYAVTSTYTAAANSIAPGSASCSASDYATGGGFALSVTDEVVIFSTSNILNGPNPTGWIVSVANHDSLFANTFSVTVICQTPITVAGIGAPEFGSLYVAPRGGRLLHAVETLLEKTNAISLTIIESLAGQTGMKQAPQWIYRRCVRQGKRLDCPKLTGDWPQ
jgi:hypothetical protein